jgi:hypothetical protein
MKRLAVLICMFCMSMGFVTGEFWTATDRTLTSSHLVTCNYDRAILTVYNTGSETVSVLARGATFPVLANNIFSFNPESFYLGEAISLNVSAPGSCVTVFTRRSPY